MADIFPTGFFGVKSALSLAPSTLNIQESTLVVIGCGPVGLCAIIAAAEQKPKHLFAIDGVDSRLEQARQLGAEPLNFLSDKAGMAARILEATEGRGADLVVEVVGLSPALRTAFDIVRPFGVISSIGVHNAEVGLKMRGGVVQFELTIARFHGLEVRHTGKCILRVFPYETLKYISNVTMNIERTFACRWVDVPFGASFLKLLFCLRRSSTCLGEPFSSSFSYLAFNDLMNNDSFMFENIMPLNEAVQGYSLFDEMKVQKVVFKP